MPVWVFVLAIAASLLFALGSVVQQRAASAAPPEKVLSFGLLWWLVRQRIWLAGIVSSLVGNILAAGAIGIGGVALAQPLFTSRLLFALALTAVIGRMRISWRDWGAAVMAAAGLAAFVAVGDPRRGHPLRAGTLDWVPALAGVAVGVAVLVVLARRQPVTKAAAVLGAAAGLLFGLQSSLTEVSIDYLRHHGPAALVEFWQPAALIVAAVYGALLIQSAYEMAPLPASFSSLVTVEPLTGLVIGVTVLRGLLRVTPASLVAEIAGLGVMLVGVALLATSPLVTGQLAALERRREEGVAYRTARQLERLLAETETAVGHFETSLGTGSNEELGSHVATASRQLRRLDALLGDMDRHRDEEVRHLRSLPPKERVTLSALEAELDERQERIRAWAAQLHREFQRLCRDDRLDGDG